MRAPRPGVAATVPARIRLLALVVLATVALASCSRYQTGLFSRSLFDADKLGRPFADRGTPDESLSAAPKFNSSGPANVTANMGLPREEHDLTGRAFVGRLIPHVHAFQATEADEARLETGKAFEAVIRKGNPAETNSKETYALTSGNGPSPLHAAQPESSTSAGPLKNRFVKGFDSQLSRLQASLKQDESRVTQSASLDPQNELIQLRVESLMDNAQSAADANRLEAALRLATSAQEIARAAKIEFRPNERNPADLVADLNRRQEAVKKSEEPWWGAQSEPLPEWAMRSPGSGTVDVLPAPETETTEPTAPIKKANEESLYKWVSLVPRSDDTGWQCKVPMGPKESPVPARVATVEPPVRYVRGIDSATGTVTHANVGSMGSQLVHADGLYEQNESPRQGRVRANQGGDLDSIQVASLTTSDQSLAGAGNMEADRSVSWPLPLERPDARPTHLGDGLPLPAGRLLPRRRPGSGLPSHSAPSAINGAGDEMPIEEPSLNASRPFGRITAIAGLAAGLVGLIGLGLWRRTRIREFAPRP